jgi:hypothetical protein
MIFEWLFIIIFLAAMLLQTNMMEFVDLVELEKL